MQYPVLTPDGEIVAHMNKSTPGLRSILENEGIEFIENIERKHTDDSDSEDEPEPIVENYSLTFKKSVHALYDFLLNYNAQPRLLSNKMFLNAQLNRANLSSVKLENNQYKHVITGNLLPDQVFSLLKEYECRNGKLYLN
ncbi:hypothetical protein HDV01_006776 [Terramyces sp. JEL0728]|nr:hypothetical protein HDV01_006776 [Terramyces sp. JEL0728]